MNMKELHTDMKYDDLVSQLLNCRNEQGFWTGSLSTSALSTSVAIVALKISGERKDQPLIKSGLDWLRKNINDDGSFGDTKESPGNISTTLLCYASISYCGTEDETNEILSKIRSWLGSKGISLSSDTVTYSILRHYGNDYTFSLPIIAMLNLCGLIPDKELRIVPVLPFELTLLPSSLYRFFNLKVVSYALPALIGVGIYLHRHNRKAVLGRVSLRDSLIPRAIKKLDSLVPASGGFLEAIPLTSFVIMCLVACEYKDNKTVEKGLRFVRAQQRADGGWPIDTDLSTWVTTLSIKALGNDIYSRFDETAITKLRDHLLSLQYKTTHPFNGAEAGGWGWTSYSGSVPDADDTPGAILALLELYTGRQEERTALSNGCRWLTRLQNSDGGFPTFCRGWGRLPFDKSCADLTGHAVLALLKTLYIPENELPGGLTSNIRKSISAGLSYLEKNQRSDGSWIPLWFGNQKSNDMTNPVYGTAKVNIYLTDCLSITGLPDEYRQPITAMSEKASVFLASQQNIDGSWGGKKGIDGTIEETALAVSALAHSNKQLCINGLSWLEKQDSLKPSPIGLYFALLWYDEEMYPLVYYVEALRRCQSVG